MAKSAKIIDPAIIREGWEALVEKMGVDRATPFVVAFEPRLIASTPVEVALPIGAPGRADPVLPRM